MEESSDDKIVDLVLISIFIGIVLLIVSIVFGLLGTSQDSIITFSGSTSSVYVGSLIISTNVTTLSVTEYNMTWINFNGVNSSVNLTLSGNKNVASLWFKNATTNWTNIINNSNTIYINGIVDPAWTFLPYYISGNNITIGKFSSSSYLNGSIDEFRIYTEVLNTTEIASVYASGHSND